MALRWLVLCVVVACGRFNFDRPGSDPDGGDGGGPGGPGGPAGSGFSGQQAYVKASNTDRDDRFGTAIALSADGSTMAIGAVGEASSATGIDGDQTSNMAQRAGAVYVFTRSGTTWTQQAYIKASNAQADDRFGSSLALSSDGAVLAVGAPGEASSATGIDGNQANNGSSGAGAVYVFTRVGALWTQSLYLKASNTDAGDSFGSAVALSATGTTLAVGASGEASASTGINGNEADNTAASSGAVYVYVQTAVWLEQAYIKASNAGIRDRFGSAVALSDDGATLAVGAPGEASSATGVDGNQADNTAIAAGAVYLFSRVGTTWTQRAYVKASNTDAYDVFGTAVALSRDGTTLAVGAQQEASRAAGVDADQTDNGGAFAGATYVFSYGTAWTQSVYIKASNAAGAYDFGNDLALDADGTRLVVAAFGESSNATGLDGDQTNTTGCESGAVYSFARSSTGAWSQIQYIKSSNTDIFTDFGARLALSRDGGTLAVTSPFERSAATGINGNQRDGSALAAGAAYVFQ